MSAQPVPGCACDGCDVVDAAAPRCNSDLTRRGGNTKGVQLAVDFGLHVEQGAGNELLVDAVNLHDCLGVVNSGRGEPQGEGLIFQSRHRFHCLRCGKVVRRLMRFPTTRTRGGTPPTTRNTLPPSPRRGNCSRLGMLLISLAGKRGREVAI